MLFDEILEQIGEGIFQKFAIVVCGLAILAEAIATTSVPFAMILVSCDLKITMDEILGLNAVLIAGMLISGYWLGGISDMSGRKYILSTTSIITFVGCFVASFSQCVIMLFISLFLLGIGLGGNHSATRIFIIEITPKSIRGSRFVILEVFSAFGYVAAIGLSRLLVPPLASSLLGNYVRLNSWRILFGLSGSLSIFSACLMSVFPASPRWLLGKKQDEDATDILRKIYAVNKVKHEESFPNIHLDPITFISTRIDTSFYQCNNPLVRSLRSVKIYTWHLFTKKFFQTTVSSIVICVCLFDGLTLINIWLGLAIFHPNMDLCTVNGASPVAVASSDEICELVALENLFKVNAYFSLCSFAVFTLLFIVDRVPRKFILMASSILSGMSTIALAFITIEVFRISLTFVILSFIFVAEVTFRIIILESYPTVLRNTAYGFIKFFSKLYLVFLVMFLQSSCRWTLIALGVQFISNMVMKLYSVSDGPPSLAVRMALKYLGVNFELVDVDFVAGYHMSDEYAEMNPQKEIPVLDDNGFYLSESNAILQYLADCYAKDDKLYPKDVKTRAIVNHRLCFNLSTYYHNIGEHVMLPIFFGYQRTPLTLKKVSMALTTFNTFLERLNKKFAADDNLTIADFQLITATLCLEAINIDLSPYPKVSEWYSRFKKEYPELWSIAEKGMKEIEQFNKNPPDLSHLNHPVHSYKQTKTQ